MPANDAYTSTRRGRLFRKFWHILPAVLLVAFFVMILGIYSVISKEKARVVEEQARTLGNERPATNVVLMELQPETIRDRLNLPGVIEPWIDLTMLAKINGEVIAVPVSEGDRVRKGDVIAQIDPADYRIALDAAQASYQLASANLQRTKALFAKGLIPRAELEDLEAQVRTSKAARDNAELMLSRCTVTAPMDGVIRRLDAKEGLFLNVGDPIGRLLQIDTVKAVVGIPESDVDAVRKIETVPLTIQALNNRKVTGRKHVLAASPNNAARLYNLELAVDNPDSALLPGMFVRADIVKQVAEASITVPLYAVISRNNEQFVFLEEDGLARRRPVRLGILEDWRAQVLEGLTAGGRLIVEGHRNVEDGQKVNIVRVLNGSEEMHR
jgi:membrane fusion protein (multidrug efflux system)